MQRCWGIDRRGSPQQERGGETLGQALVIGAGGVLGTVVRTTVRAQALSRDPHMWEGLGDLFHSGALDAETALELGAKWLGDGYVEAAPGSGVFRSADGLRQFRMTTEDLLGAHGNMGPHVHFESLNR